MEYLFKPIRLLFTLSICMIIKPVNNEVRHWSNKDNGEILTMLLNIKLCIYVVNIIFFCQASVYNVLLYVLLIFVFGLIRMAKACAKTHGYLVWTLWQMQWTRHIARGQIHKGSIKWDPSKNYRVSLTFIAFIRSSSFGQQQNPSMSYRS